ncbi:hypothetical protein RN607_14255 [Demequina capsici]|uniref:Lipoprotein n=1 Tax=Demequina capsici TaxID=3075620 RepID=A0AA96J9J7_9MICO|nr:hypothetical protein [Demequina sp. PMTSA13]WNM27342.1 hypothetical protein RN607_14255 [Demequina sp. PMTSA13]
MNKQLVVLAGGALLLGACSAPTATDSPSGSPTAAAHELVAVDEVATASASPAPAAVEVEITLEEAGQQYLDIVRPVNEAILAKKDAWDAAVDASDWETLTEISATWEDANRAFVDAMLTAEWPDDLQPYVDTIVTDTADDIAFYAGVAKATTVDEFQTAWLYPVDFSNAAAQDLRIRLGLGNVGEDE